VKTTRDQRSELYNSARCTRGNPLTLFAHEAVDLLDDLDEALAAAERERSELLEWKARAERAEAALRSIEWTHEDGPGEECGRWCPDCGNLQRYGRHRDGCAIGAVLALAARPEGPDERCQHLVSLDSLPPICGQCGAIDPWSAARPAPKGGTE
jgi:hypothetical protein